MKLIDAQLSLIKEYIERLERNQLSLLIVLKKKMSTNYYAEENSLISKVPLYQMKEILKYL